MVKYIVLDFGMVLAYYTTGNWYVTPKFSKSLQNLFIDYPFNR